MSTLRSLRRLSLALAACTLVLFVAGALITGAGTAGDAGRQATGDGAAWLALHRTVGFAAGALALGLLWALARAKLAGWLTTLGVAAVAGLGLQAALGATLTRNWSLQSPAVAVVHAVWPFLVFGAISLFSLGVSAAWSGQVANIEDRGVPSLRSLAKITPVAVVVQVILGAAYRREALGAVPHVAWAFAVVLLVLMLGTFVLTSAAQPEHRPVRRSAVALMSLAGVQLMLGVLAFLARLGSGSPFGEEFTTAVRAAHLATGALVFAATLNLSAWILRSAVRADEKIPAANLARS